MAMSAAARKRLQRQREREGLVLVTVALPAIELAGVLIAARCLDPTVADQPGALSRALSLYLSRVTTPPDDRW
jgi:hypothetical protein